MNHVGRMTIKRLIAAGIFGLFISGNPLGKVSGISFAEENLVPNPSFEEPADDGGKAKGWPAGNYLRDAAIAKFDNYSVKIDGESLREAVSDKFPLEGSKKYVVSFWHKDNGSGARIFVTQFDKDNKAVWGHYWDDTSKDWKQDTHTFIAHPATYYGQITLRQSSKDASWIDMVELKEFKGETPITRDLSYTYSIQPNDGTGAPGFHDPGFHVLIDGDTTIGMQYVIWTGSIIKEGLNIDFDLHRRYVITKVVIYSFADQGNKWMDDAELYLDDGKGYEFAGIAEGYRGSSLGAKETTFEDIEAPAQKVRLKLKTSSNILLTEVEIYGKEKK